MSQVVKIKRVSFRGVPAYLGEDHGHYHYSGNPEIVAKWMCDGYRTRFNQHRSKRCKYVYADGEKVLGLDGSPMLTPIGGSVTDLTDKQVREQFSYLAGIPAMVLQAPTKIENAEWFAAAKRKKAIGGSMPGFRSRKRGDMRFTCWFNGGANALFHRTGKRSGMLEIRGQNPPSAKRKGRWTLRFHVHLSQDIRPYTSVQVDMAHRKVSFVNEAPTLDRTLAKGSAGIDRGVAHAAVTSDGEFFDIPETPELDKEVVALQRKMARQRRVADKQGGDWKSSNRYRDTRRKCAAAQTRRASVKKDAIHVFTKRIAETYEVVIAEALKVKNMSRKAKGTGSSAKRSLNRGIADARWSTMLFQLNYKMGGNVIVVNPAYTSQRCSECGYIDSDNRESQSVFVCKACGHTDNADVNAAKNIEAKHYQGWTTPAWSKGKTGKAMAEPAPALKRKPPALSGN
jgi:putative transposase